MTLARGVLMNPGMARKANPVLKAYNAASRAYRGKAGFTACLWADRQAGFAAHSFLRAERCGTCAVCAELAK